MGRTARIHASDFESDENRELRIEPLVRFQYVPLSLGACLERWDRQRHRYREVAPAVIGFVLMSAHAC